MTKIDELSMANSCFNKAGFGEMMFILLARDKSAPVAIQAWIDHRISTGKNKPNDPKILEAEACIAYMKAQWGL